MYPSIAHTESAIVFQTHISTCAYCYVELRLLDRVLLRVRNIKRQSRLMTGNTSLLLKRECVFVERASPVKEEQDFHSFTLG